jgi:UDP-N-acetylmuramate--alanine ligase
MKRFKRIHFIGIGGVSMSGIAMELAKQGHIVSGSDISTSKTNYYLRQVEAVGNIKVFQGNKSENILNNIEAVVITSTVFPKNPELIRAKELNIPVFERTEIINSIVAEYEVGIGIFGGAGKTTTTALCYFLFEQAGLAPSLFLGSILHSLQSSVHLEKEKKICIFETDESDASFSKMAMNAGIFVALESDHLEHDSYDGCYNKMKNLFRDLLLKLKDNNSPLCINYDSPEVMEMANETLHSYPHLKTFSLTNKNATFYGANFRFTYQGMCFDIYIEGKLFQTCVFMPLIGKCNALNVLGGLAALSFFAKPDECKIALGHLKNFKGIDKRLTTVGTFRNFDIIDDYAHSPLKIKTMLSSFFEYAEAIEAKVIPICEIHKFSRFKMMYEEFKSAFITANFLILMDVYAVAGYEGDKIDIYNFIKEVKTLNPEMEIIYISNENLPLELLRIIKMEKYSTQKRNFLLFMGAGLSSKHAKEMQNALEEIENGISSEVI